MLSLKRGQLTIFVIVAIVIVVAIMGYFLIRSNLTQEQKYDEKVSILRDNVIYCFESSYSESLNTVGFQGGYSDVIEPNEEYIVPSFSISVPYHYFEGQNKVPTFETIQNEIVKESIPSIKDCIETYSSVVSYTNIEFSEPQINVEINEEEVVFVTNTIMSVDYDEKSVNVDLGNEQIIVRSKIYQMREISNYISEYLIENKEWIPYQDLVVLSQRANLYLNSTDEVDGESTFISVGTYEVDSYPKRFNFLLKYKLDDFDEVLPLL